MKVVINTCYGGFSLSDKALEYYGELKNLGLVKQKGQYFGLTGYDWYIGEINDDNHFWCGDIARDDPELIRVVEELGDKSFGRYAKLKVVQIPDGVDWQIVKYGGMESVAEKHRTWE